MKNYDYSVKFLKKALQYAWLRKYDYYEQRIFEELGMVYFHMGSMNKAMYFHERLEENSFLLYINQTK
jgi:hypothetical protein